MTHQASEQSAKQRLVAAVRPLAIACGLVGIALLASFPLQRVIAYPFVFLFFGAIMVSAWLGGAVAGLWAALLASLVVNFFFIPPLYSITVAKEAQTFWAAFILCAFVLAWVISGRKRAERLVRQANDRLEGMVQERTAALERSNQELGERERRLRELTEAIPQQIWRAGPDGALEYLNRPLRSYLGLEPQQPIAEQLVEWVHPQDWPQLEAAWARALFAQESFEAEVRIRSGEGLWRWFLVRGNPQRAGDGSIAHWYGIHIDIEQQRRAQQGLQTAQEELSRLSRTLTMAEMAASIAHELNQPLTAVVTHAYACREWLRDDRLNLERAKTTAEKIVQESTRASEVVRRVRRLFQKESPVCQQVQINELIEQLAVLLRPEAIRRNVEVRLELADELVPLDVDPVLITQVLLNLALNGMEAMSGRTTDAVLTIGSTVAEPGYVQIWVEDRGPGVPTELVQRIFEPFFSTGKDGTGMGLAICRSIVEAHGGRIAVETAASGGARFQFSLKADA